MIKTGGGEPSPNQPADPYGGTFEPTSGVGPTITPTGTGSVGGWTPPANTNPNPSPSPSPSPKPNPTPG